MAFNFPNTPAIGDIYTPSSGQTYTWDGGAWIVTVDSGAASTDYVLKIGDVMTGALRLPPTPPVNGSEAAHKDYVDQTTDANFVYRAGDTMAGALLLPAAQPTAPTEAAHKDYVDQSVAATALYQGVWQPGPNIPDLTPSVVNALHSYSWIAITADPAVPEFAPAGLPGIGGFSIAESDTIIWNATTSVYELVRAPSSGTGAFLPIVGGTLTGPIHWAPNNIGAVDYTKAQLKLNKDATFQMAFNASTTGQLNYLVENASNRHSFYVAGIEKARITSGGLDAVTGLWIGGLGVPYVAATKVTPGGWGAPTNNCYAVQVGRVVTVSGYIDASFNASTGGTAFTIPASMGAPVGGFGALSIFTNGIPHPTVGLEINSARVAIVKGPSIAGWTFVSGSYITV